LKDTKGRKFDVIIDGAGDLSGLSKLAAGGARIVSYGSTANPTATLVLPMLFLLNNMEILGTAMGSPEEFEGLLQLVNKSKLVPVVDEVFTLKDFPRALDKMRKGEQFGKLVLDHSKL
jgi:D-arabinose 1-dehydrogenase-like Zn-dependent alcohol dehydrogenase